jgi:hypothetical protein
MAEASKWDRKVAKLIGRQWADVRPAWMGYIPAIDVPGVAPQESLADLPTVQAAVSDVDGDHPKSVAEEITGLRSGVLAEALFVLHKAANVMGCAQVHVARGLCSWSLSSAYHAAFFGMKAILQLLGVVVIETGDQSYLVDVWAEPDKKHKKNILGPKHPVLIQKVQRVEHRHLWGCFQRMLRVCTAPAEIWPVGCVQSLRELDIKGFARQRNKLHYTTSSWPFQDLHACNVIADFGRHLGGLDDGEAVSDPGNTDFSIALGLVLLRMGCQMVLDLAETVPAVRAEWDLLRTWLAGDCNQLYQAAYATF